MNNESNTNNNEEIETLAGTTPTVETPQAPVPVTPTPEAPQAPTTPVAPAVAPQPVEAPVAPPVAPTPVTPPVEAPVQTPPPVAPAVQPAVAQPTVAPVQSNTGSITINGETVATETPNTEVKQEEKKPFDKKIIIYPVVILLLAGGFIYLLLNKNKDTSTTTPTPTPTITATPEPLSGDKILLENAKITGYQCLNSVCSVSIGDEEESSEYDLKITNSELFKALSDYNDYININVYYISSGDKNTIVDYKLFLKSSNEDISSITKEEELREKIGLFSTGTHVESLTLTKIGSEGFGSNDDGEYTYREYTFTDAKNIKYEMKYKNPDSSLKLTEGNKYTVGFEVVKDDFGYNYNISSIK